MENTMGRRRSRLTMKLMSQYFITLGVYTVLIPLFAFLGILVCSQMVWYEISPLYRFLRLIYNNLILFGIIGVLTGWCIITLLYFRRIICYLDEVVTASEQLAQPGNQPIVLSQTLKSVQDEMNGIREEALAGAQRVREAEQRKNDLIVYLAHDLKTPLTSVIGYLTLLGDEEELGEELWRKYTGIALEKALRLEDLINEFFDITRFNLAEVMLERETIDLSRMLEQITYEFEPALADKELTFETDFAPKTEIYCDGDKLSRVFDNLIRNAVNYSYKGTKIRISLEDGTDEAVVKILNYGKTIPKERLERIFEQFFRLDSARQSTTGGAGLGLAIAKEFVTRHGGRIQAESGDETIQFTVILPKNRHKIV